MGDPEKDVAVITCGLGWIRWRHSGLGGVLHTTTTGSDQSDGSSQQPEEELPPLPGLEGASSSSLELVLSSVGGVHLPTHHSNVGERGLPPSTRGKGGDTNLP